MPALMSAWFAVMSAVRLFPSLNHCPRVILQNMSRARSSGDSIFINEELPSWEDSMVGSSGIQSVPPMRTSLVLSFPASRMRPFAKDPIVFGHVLPVDGLVDVLEKEHPGAFDVVDDDDVVHRHVRRSTALKDLLSVAERDPVDLDAGGLPYGIDQ